MGHDDVFEKIFVHAVDVIDTQATELATPVGWGEEGDELRGAIDSAKQFL